MACVVLHNFSIEESSSENKEKKVKKDKSKKDKKAEDIKKEGKRVVKVKENAEEIKKS